MSKQLLKILLGELKVARIVCKASGCGAAIEIPVDKLEKWLPPDNCLVCNAPFNLPSGTSAANALPQLGRVFSSIERFKELFDVEFVLPVHEDEK